MIDKIGLLCDFCGGAIGGQTTRNNEIIDFLQRKGIRVNVCDTYGLGRKKIFLLYLRLKKLCSTNSDIIIVEGVCVKKYMWPLLVLMKKKYNNHFFELMVGGNEADILPNYKSVIKSYYVIDKVYAETNMLTKRLQQIGIENAVWMPTAIPIKKYINSEVDFKFNAPLPICTLSRVCKEKGIKTAVDAVRMANKRIGKFAYHLDIFGPIDDKYKSEFKKILSENEEEVTYCGFLDESKKTWELHDHYIFLFPTEHHGEGFPATLIDVFSAGIPVICSDINALPEIVEDGRLGYVVHEPYVENMANCLVDAYHSPKKIYKMRKEALNEAEKYDVEFVWNQLWNDIVDCNA